MVNFYLLSPSPSADRQYPSPAQARHRVKPSRSRYRLKLIPSPHCATVTYVGPITRQILRPEVNDDGLPLHEPLVGENFVRLAQGIVTLKAGKTAQILRFVQFPRRDANRTVSRVRSSNSRPSCPSPKLQRTIAPAPQHFFHYIGQATVLSPPPQSASDGVFPDHRFPGASSPGRICGCPE